MVPLLPCGVPDLKLDDVLVDLNSLRKEGSCRAREVGREEGGRESGERGGAYNAAARAAAPSRRRPQRASAPARHQWREGAERRRRARDNAPPIVLSWNSWNWSFTKRITRLDFPTAVSPSSTSLNVYVSGPSIRAGSVCRSGHRCYSAPPAPRQSDGGLEGVVTSHHPWTNLKRRWQLMGLDSTSA